MHFLKYHKIESIDLRFPILRRQVAFNQQIIAICLKILSLDSKREKFEEVWISNFRCFILSEDMKLDKQISPLTRSELGSILIILQDISPVLFF